MHPNEREVEKPKKMFEFEEQPDPIDLKVMATVPILSKPKQQP